MKSTHILHLRPACPDSGNAPDPRAFEDVFHFNSPFIVAAALYSLRFLLWYSDKPVVTILVVLFVLIWIMLHV